MTEEKDTKVVLCKWYSEVTWKLFRCEEQVKNIKKNTANTFPVRTNLLNSENLKVAFVQLCNQLKGCNFNMV